MQTWPDPAAASGTVVGEARSFQVRVEPDLLDRQRQWMVWTFRLERFDNAGNRLNPVLVQMRGLRFEGGISDGDWVAVGGAASADGIIHVDGVRNLTTGALVQATGDNRPVWLWVLFGVLLAIVLVIFLASVVLIVRVIWEFPFGLTT
jgi:hypothetical protein